MTGARILKKRVSTGRAMELAPHRGRISNSLYSAASGSAPRTRDQPAAAYWDLIPSLRRGGADQAQTARFYCWEVFRLRCYRKYNERCPGRALSVHGIPLMGGSWNEGELYGFRFVVTGYMTGMGCEPHGLILTIRSIRIYIKVLVLQYNNSCIILMYM